MTDLLIRDIPDDVKKKLAVRAAENGRSQGAEAREILQEALVPERKNWVQMLIDASQECGGFELERPTWAPAREFSFDEE